MKTAFNFRIGERTDLAVYPRLGPSQAGRAGSSSHRSSVVLRFALVSQPDPTAESPMTAPSLDLHHYRGRDLNRDHDNLALQDFLNANRRQWHICSGTAQGSRRRTPAAPLELRLWLRHYRAYA
jgi:hypothetical protein